MTRSQERPLSPARLARKRYVTGKSNPDGMAMPVGRRRSGNTGELRIAISTAMPPNAGDLVIGVKGVTARRDGNE